MSSSNKYAVVIGETGSGKSTFINYVANYFYKGSLRRPSVVIPTNYQPVNMNYYYNEYSINDMTTSKTADCQRYSFNLYGVKFHFIDTPGVNDTSGYLEDSQNVEKVFSYIENIAELNALILILNGAIARVTINIENVLAIYRDRLPDAIYSNMIIILTNCEEHTVNFSCSNAGLPEQCSVFYMQNSAFSGDPRLWSSAAVTSLQRHFDSSMQTMDRIINKLLSFKPTSTKLFKDMKDDRNKIKQQLHQARMMILDLQNFEDELTAFESSAEIYTANAEKYQHYVSRRKVEQNEDIRTQYHNTRCFNCNTVCHENCRLDEVLQPGSKSLYHCSAMDSKGYCEKCPNLCPAKFHFHTRFITKKKMVSVNDIVESKYERYRQAKEGLQEASWQCNKIEASKKVLEYELRQQYNNVNDSIRGLQKTCKDLNITAILFQFIDLLEKDSYNLRSPTVITKSREFIANLRQLCDNSERANSRPQTPRFLVPENRLSKNLMICAQPKTRASLAATDTLKVEDLHRQTANEFSSSKNLRPPLSYHGLSTLIDDIHDADNEIYHDVDDIEHPNDNDPLFVQPKSTNQGNKSQQQQIMTNDRVILECTIDKEKLAMLPMDQLIHFSNISANDFEIREIRDEVQRRCNGESIGFLTRAEQLVLCDQYAKHQQMEFQDLLRLSVQLLDEIKELIGNDPFKSNCIPVEKRLQLSAINLLIRKTDRL